MTSRKLGHRHEEFFAGRGDGKFKSLIAGKRSEGMSRGKPDGQAEHERWFADRFALADVFLVLGIVDEVDVQRAGEVGDVGDFVGRGAGRKQLARVVVTQFFVGHPADALDETADDLAAIDAGVDRLADVHQQVGPIVNQFASEAIDGHFRDRGAGSVVEERIAAASFAIVVDAGRGEETACPQINTFATGPWRRTRRKAMRCEASESRSSKI